jgi:hypothetical protein
MSFTRNFPFSYIEKLAPKNVSWVYDTILVYWNHRSILKELEQNQIFLHKNISFHFQMFMFHLPLCRVLDLYHIEYYPNN